MLQTLFWISCCSLMPELPAALLFEQENKMKISEVIIKLKNLKKANDNKDMDVWLEVGKDVPCKSCGEEKRVSYDGLCTSIIALNIDGKKAVILDADCI